MSMAMHPKISVHEVCFPPSMDVDAILRWAEQHGVAHVGLFSLRRSGGDWSAAIASVNASPISIAYLSHASMFILDDPSGWDASARAVMATIDAAKAMGAPIVYATTGPAGRLDFDQAVEALSRAIVPVRDYAREQGISLLIETAGPQFCFTHFVHNFEDTLYVAEQAGIGVCLDLHPTWYERGIDRKIAAAGRAISLVQVSDHIPRNMSGGRDIIGQGIVPIERLLRATFDAGYDGIIDLELFGRAETTTADDTLLGAKILTEILYKIGFK